LENILRIEAALSQVLRFGVLLSAVLIFMGLALTFLTGDISHPFGVLNLRWVIWGDPFLEPSHLLFLGFAVLIATPVLRIAASILMYLETRDIPFAAITSLVLLILIISFTMGVG